MAKNDWGKGSSVACLQVNRFVAVVDTLYYEHFMMLKHLFEINKKNISKKVCETKLYLMLV